MSNSTLLCNTFFWRNWQLLKLPLHLRNFQGKEECLLTVTLWQLEECLENVCICNLYYFKYRKPRDHHHCRILQIKQLRNTQMWYDIYLCKSIYYIICQIFIHMCVCMYMLKIAHFLFSFPWKIIFLLQAAVMTLYEIWMVVIKNQNYTASLTYKCTYVNARMYI